MFGYIRYKNHALSLIILLGLESDMAMFCRLLPHVGDEPSDVPADEEGG